MQPLSYLLIFRTVTNKDNFSANLNWRPNVPIYQRQKKSLAEETRHAMWLKVTESLAILSQRLHRECKIDMYTFLQSKLSSRESLNSISKKIKGKIWQEHSSLNVAYRFGSFNCGLKWAWNEINRTASEV